MTIMDQTKDDKLSQIKPPNQRTEFPAAGAGTTDPRGKRSLGNKITLLR